jgi:outer membrane protein OmpA-like peptidoglycan-associated protein
MRKALVSVLLLIALSLSSFSQTFTLTDSQCTVGNYYRTYNLAFDLGKTTLRSESFPHLDSIAAFLNTNSSLKLEIGVHTDSRVCESDITSSRKLHQARAKAIADYMTEQGIAADRLIAKGYGCFHLLITDAAISKLKTKEEIEAAHQKNRRVEFKILAI